MCWIYVFIDKKVALWNEVNGPNNLITAANFCQNGKFAVVGSETYFDYSLGQKKIAIIIFTIIIFQHTMGGAFSITPSSSNITLK